LAKGLQCAVVVKMVSILEFFKDMNLEMDENQILIACKLPDGFADYINRCARKILDGEEGEAKKILKAIDAMFAAIN
jgi:hypothetical protein